MPPDNLANTLSSMGFDSLVAAAKKAGLVATLSTGGPFTIFAPTDAAFAKLGDISSLSVNALKEILLYHVVSGRVLSKDLKNGAVPSVEGSNIQVCISSGATTASGEKSTIVRLNKGAKVIRTDTIATNGIIHTIDTVLVLPQ